MFLPEPEILLLRRMFNLFEQLESKLDSFGLKQEEQDTLLNVLVQKVHGFEQQEDIRQEKYAQIEFLPSPYSNDGDPICNYSTSHFCEDEEV